MKPAENPGSDGQKKSQRALVRTNRKNLPAEQAAKLATELAAQAFKYLEDSTGTVTRVGLYLSTDEEPGTQELLERLVQAGIEVYLPICQPNHVLEWTAWQPGIRLARSAVAPVDEPVGPRFGPEIFEQLHTLFIPALLVDEHGARLGQGGGYYDRFLPHIAQQATRIAALVYAQEFVLAGTFPVQSHDRPVDVVITPEGYFSIAAH